MNNKKAFITGGTGFIGSNLSKHLYSKGWKVDFLVRDSSDLNMLVRRQEEYIFHKYDGSLSSIVKAMKDSKPDIVFHLASRFISEHKPLEVEELITSNIYFPSQLLEAMSEVGIKKIINTGTSWQHYQNSIYNPVNLYAATKEAFEKIIEFYVQSQNFQSFNLKLFDTYGKGDQRGKLISHVIYSIKNHMPLLLSPGEQMMNLVYIDDIVSAFEMAALNLINEPKSLQRSFGVSSNETISIKNLIETIQDIMNLEGKIDWGGKSYRQREVMTPWNNFERIPGWKPKIGLIEGLTRVIKDQ